MTQAEVKTEPETITELEAKLIDRIRKMSIDQQMQVLELLDTSIPESMEETPETTVEEPELEISPLKRQQKAVEILQRLAASGGIMPGIDPLEWQREERKDRPLPGRED